MNDKQQSFNRLLKIMDELREKCPWDREQTFESLRSNTIEETYELIDAINTSDIPNIKKELGGNSGSAARMNVGRESFNARDF